MLVTFKRITYLWYMTKVCQICVEQKKKKQKKKV